MPREGDLPGHPQTLTNPCPTNSRKAPAVVDLTADPATTTSAKRKAPEADVDQLPIQTTIPWYRLTVRQARAIANKEGLYRPSYGPSTLLGDSFTADFPPLSSASINTATCSPPPSKQLSPFAADFHPSISLSTRTPAPLDLQEVLREQGRTLPSIDTRAPSETRPGNRATTVPPPQPAVQRTRRSKAPPSTNTKEAQTQKGPG